MNAKLKTVMLVDDVEANNFINEIVFEDVERDINVVSFNMATKAIEAIKSGLVIPDLIMLDINMPAMNGWQFLDALGGLEFDAKNSIVVIMLSSSEDEEEINRAKSHELVSDYCVKPLSVERAQEIINAYF